MQKIRAAGIKGIRYLDQGSRAEGEGTYNYVVFDESIIEIVKKNDVPVLTPKAQEARSTIKAATETIVRRINPTVAVEFVDELFAEGPEMIASGAETAERGEVAGMYLPLRNVVQLSLNISDAEITETAFHEAWHTLERLLTKAEKALLEKAFPAGAGLSHAEAVAYTFGRWAAGKDVTLKPQVRSIFVKIRQFLTRFANMLRGHGFQTVEDVFERAYTGEMGRRATVKPDPRVSDMPTDMADEIVEALVDVGVSEKAARAMTVREARQKLVEATGAQYARQPQSLGTAQQEAIIRKLTLLDDRRPWWLAMRDYVSERIDLFENEWRQGVFDFADAVARLEKQANRGRLKDAAESAWKMVHKTQNLRGVMMVVLRYGPLRYNDATGTFEVIRGDPDSENGFEGILKPLADRGLLQLWKAWAIAVRANRLNREGRENLMAKIANELGLPDTQAAIDTLLKLGGDPMDPDYRGPVQHPEFAAAFRKWQKFNKAMLDMAEAAGVINPVTRGMWEKEDYVPFYRVLEQTSRLLTPGKRTRGIQGQRAPIKELKGGEQMIGDVVENMVLNMTYLVDASYKNVAMQRATDLAVAAGVMTRVSNVDVVRALVPAAAMRKALLSIGVNVDKLSPADRRKLLTTFQLVPPQGSDIVSVMVDGNAEYYQVHDPLLYRSLVGMNSRTRDHWAQMVGIGAKRVLTTGVTAFPKFMVRNAMRDTMSNRVIVGEKIDFGWATVKGLADSMRMEPDLVDIYAGGGGFSGFYESGALQTRRRIEKMTGRSLTPTSALQGTWENWQKVGSASENANRLAIYRAVRKRGGSVAEAIHEAQDLLNYSMRGDWALIDTLVTYVPFFNARLQGLYKLGRAAGGQGGKNAGKLFLIQVGKRTLVLSGAVLLRGLFLAALSSAYWYMVHDDERYDDLDEWEKDASFHFWLGEGEDAWRISVPKPFEVGAIFSTIPERVLSAIFKGEVPELGTALGRMFWDTFAMDPTPQVIKPVFEQMTNRLSYFDRPIVNQSLRGRQPEEQFDQYTSETAVLLARALQGQGPDWMRSPKRIQAFLRGYLGDFATYGLAATDVVSREILGWGVEPAKRHPLDMQIFRGLVQQGEHGTKWDDLFYDLREDVNTLQQSISALQAQGDVARAERLMEDNQIKLSYRKQLNRMGRTLSDMRKERNLVHGARDLDADQKRARLDDLEKEYRDIVKSVKKITLDIEAGITNPEP